MDFYEMMLGNPSAERMKLLADRLRRREARAELAMLTGDPVLTPFGQAQYQRIGQQQQGLARMRAAQAKAKRYRTLTVEEAAAQGLRPGSYQVEEGTGQIRQIGAPQTIVNMSAQTPEGKRIGERAALVKQYGPASDEVRRYDMDQLTAGQVTNIGQIEPTRQMLESVAALTTGEKPAVDVGERLLGLQSMAESSRFGSLIPGTLTKDEARLVGDLERVENTILALARGAQVGPAEQERFARQLPRVGQDPTLFKQNLEATQRNLNYLTNLYRTMAPSMFVEPDPTASAAGQVSSRLQELRKRAAAGDAVAAAAVEAYERRQQQGQ